MTLTIGQVAKSIGIPAKTIRFYEAAGVLPRPSRTASGYRQYTADSLQQLQFVRRARVLGLSLRDLKRLTVVWDGADQQPLRARVREVIGAHLFTIQTRIRELRALERDLGHVLSRIDNGSGKRPSTGGCHCLDGGRERAANARRTSRR